ncbi:MAG: hypothetical protein WC431_00400 [Candidatus Omnitrophota bacterium]|jgi:DNA-binding transcriptional MerR regulator
MKANLIRTEKFVKNFPRQAQEFMEYYGFLTKPNITYRTFRYYVTKKLLPKPIIINNKSFYENTSTMYKKLFLVWYLVHFRRKSSDDIQKIMNSIHSQEELKCIIMFLNNDDFLDEVIQNRSIKNTTDNICKNSSFIKIGNNLLFKILRYSLEKDIEDCKYFIKRNVEGWKRIEWSQVNELKKRMRFYTKIKDQLEKAIKKIKKISALYNFNL